MDGLADIDGIAAHFDGQADFADHVAGTWADNGTTDHAMRFGIENQLGETIVGAVGDGASGCRPRELGDINLAAFLLRLLLGDADPRHFRMCVGDAGDHLRVKRCPRQFGVVF